MIIDVSKAISPSRHRREGPAADTEGSREFQRQYPEQARRYNWIQNQVLWPEREAPVNPNRWRLATTRMSMRRRRMGGGLSIGRCGQIAARNNLWPSGVYICRLEEPSWPFVRRVIFCVGLKL